MRIQTEGIVLRYFRYGDSAMIAHIYTEAYGRQSFFFRGAKSRSAKRKMHFLQPLALLEIPIDYKASKEFYTGNGAQTLQIFNSIPFEQIKTSCAFFIAELLSKLLQAHEADKPLFDFLKAAILFLDSDTTKGANFHLTFLVKLTSFLGIQPEIVATERAFLNIAKGKFTTLHEAESCSEEHSLLWKTLQKENWIYCDELLLSREQRNSFLKKLLQYYTYHLQDLGQLKSLVVLQNVFE